MKNLFFGGIIETHVKQPKCKKLINGVFPGWSFDDNYGFSDLGKIWVLWHHSVKVVVVSKSLQMITCEVLFPDCQEWFVVSIVYAANEEPPRRDLWSELVSLSTSPAVKDKAWIVMGDFNQTLDPSEHSHPPSLNVDRHMRDFRDCLAAAELSDMVFRGNTFTWWNKSKTRPVAKKLDRILVNDNWPILFPASHSFFGEPDFSDHASCGVVLDTQKLRVRSPFKFYNFLLLNPDFTTLIEYHWFSLNVSGSTMYRLSKKLKSLKFIMREFNKDNFSNLEKGSKRLMRFY